MKKLSLIIISLFISTALFTGCRTNPVRNITDAPINVSGNPGMGQVREAIITAGNSLGWNMKPVESGHIIGTLYIRAHVAVVDVNYDATSYSITYKDSENLKYDGTKIHSNYNGWVQNLNRAINIQLSSL